MANDVVGQRNSYSQKASESSHRKVQNRRRPIRVYLVVVVIASALGVLGWRLLHPPRPMFHNSYSKAGYKGPLPFWPLPPAHTNESRTQEIHVDHEYNLLVLLCAYQDPNASLDAADQPRWGGRAEFAPGETRFEYLGHVVTISAVRRNEAIVLTPSAKIFTHPLKPNEAQAIYEAVGQNMPKDLFDELVNAESVPRDLREFFAKARKSD